MDNIIWSSSDLDAVQIVKVYKYDSANGQRHNINVQFTKGFMRLLGNPKKVDIGFSKDLNQIFVKANSKGHSVNGTNTTINKMVKVLGDGIIGNYEGELVGDTFIGVKLDILGGL